MAIFTNLCLVVFSLVGVGTAIAVPLSLNSQGKGTGSASRPSGGASQPKLTVTKCASSDTGQATVSFGESNTKEICWTRDPQTGTAENTQEETKLSELFQSMWEHKDQSWSSKSGHLWRQQCVTGGSNQFILPQKDQSSGTEYVGLCDSTASTTQWVSVETKDQGSSGITVKVCSGEDCWQTQQSTYTTQQDSGIQGGSTIKQPSSPNTGKWSTIIFKKKS